MEGLKEGGVRMFCVGFVLQKRGVAKTDEDRGVNTKREKEGLWGVGGEGISLTS